MDFGTIKRKLKVTIRTRNNLKNIVDSYQALDDTLKSLDETADALRKYSMKSLWLGRRRI